MLRILKAKFHVLNGLTGLVLGSFLLFLLRNKPWTWFNDLIILVMIILVYKSITSLKYLNKIKKYRKRRRKIKY